MPVLVVCLLIVLVSLIGGAVYGINKLIPTSKQMDLTEYYGQNADGEASLVAGTQKLEQKALISGDEVYIPLDVVNGYLNQRYYWDSANKRSCMRHQPVLQRRQHRISLAETYG